MPVHLGWCLLSCVLYLKTLTTLSTYMALNVRMNKSVGFQVFSSLRSYSHSRGIRVA